MNPFLQSAILLLLTIESLQLVLMPEVAQRLNDKLMRTKNLATALPERKLFLITQSTIDENNYESRTKCT